MGTLIAAIDELVADDPSDLADRDTLVELHRQLARLEAVTTRATGAFDANQEWEGDGARGSAAWLARRCGLPRQAAKRRVWLARAMRHLPATGSAWLAGDINGSHAGVLAGARCEATADALAEFEDQLVGFAKSLSFSAFSRAVKYWTQVVDPDGAERSDQEKVERRPAAPVADLRGLLGRRLPVGPRLRRHRLGRAGPPGAVHVRGRPGRGPGPAGT